MAADKDPSECAIMHSIFTASVGGSKPVKFAHLTTVNGNSKNTVIRTETWDISVCPSCPPEVRAAACALLSF
ncbi:hypothetical protein IEQ34_004514 [Dendrobium chrysotoxum]|uniref:Uncharacterized protein n=1 Tax=Dendrobium chrysotoxum TaxID=161865 RepID=A0AAV7HE86_DENCH|nr:hypothetical protein IEQ34_004514 [Dendrobium chrysotoxum]